jgi:hypothetical protein
MRVHLFLDCGSYVAFIIPAQFQWREQKWARIMQIELATLRLIYMYGSSGYLWGSTVP